VENGRGGEQDELLVVEDDGMHRLVFGAYLRGVGLRVGFAVDGAHAIARLEERPFALVLMDVDLPDVDGLEVTRRLRALEQEQPARKRTPVVALTAYGGANDVRRALASGCDGYLVKPVTRDLLRESVSGFAARGNQAPDGAGAPALDAAPDLRPELLDMATQMVGQLLSALELGRRDEIRRLGHKLRGSAGTFGLDRLGAIAHEIETAALAADRSALADAIDRLAKEVAAAKTSIAPPSPSA
jgi:CheY-like chemotaxis protein